MADEFYINRGYYFEPARRSNTDAISLPKIAAGRNTRSAKTLWKDHEHVKIQGSVDKMRAIQDRGPDLYIPKFPKPLKTWPIQMVPMYKVLHAPSRFGTPRHDTRDLYATATDLTNAIRNVNDNTSYKSLRTLHHTRRQPFSYTRDEGETFDPGKLRWRSANSVKPSYTPRRLEPLIVGRRTDSPNGYASFPPGRKTVNSPVDKPKKLGRGEASFLELYRKRKLSMESENDRPAPVGYAAGDSKESFGWHLGDSSAEDSGTLLSLGSFSPDIKAQIDAYFAEKLREEQEAYNAAFGLPEDPANIQGESNVEGEVEGVAESKAHLDGTAEPGDGRGSASKRTDFTDNQNREENVDEQNETNTSSGTVDTQNQQATNDSKETRDLNESIDNQQVNQSAVAAGDEGVSEDNNAASQEGVVNKESGDGQSETGGDGEKRITPEGALQVGENKEGDKQDVDTESPKKDESQEIGDIRNTADIRETEETQIVIGENLERNVDDDNENGPVIIVVDEQGANDGNDDQHTVNGEHENEIETSGNLDETVQDPSEQVETVENENESGKNEEVQDNPTINGDPQIDSGDAVNESIDNDSKGGKVNIADSDDAKNVPIETDGGIKETDDLANAEGQSEPPEEVEEDLPELVGEEKSDSSGDSAELKDLISSNGEVNHAETEEQDPEVEAEVIESDVIGQGGDVEHRQETEIVENHTDDANNLEEADDNQAASGVSPGTEGKFQNGEDGGLVAEDGVHSDGQTERNEDADVDLGEPNSAENDAGIPSKEDDTKPDESVDAGEGRVDETEGAIVANEDTTENEDTKADDNQPTE